MLFLRASTIYRHVRARSSLPEVFCKNGKISHNSQENTCARVSFLIRSKKGQFRIFPFIQNRDANIFGNSFKSSLMFWLYQFLNIFRMLNFLKILKTLQVWLKICYGLLILIPKRFIFVNAILYQQVKYFR